MTEVVTFLSNRRLCVARVVEVARFNIIGVTTGSMNAGNTGNIDSG